MVVMVTRICVSVSDLTASETHTCVKSWSDFEKKIDWPMSARVECRPRLLSAICRFN